MCLKGFCDVIYRALYSGVLWDLSRQRNQLPPLWGTGPRFTNGFSIAIQIRGKFHFILISILIQLSLQIFVHGRTAVLSWHVQNLLRSDGQQQNYSKGKFPSNLNCGQKIVSETGPWEALEEDHSNSLTQDSTGWHTFDRQNFQDTFVNENCCILI